MSSPPSDKTSKLFFILKESFYLFLDNLHRLHTHRHHLLDQTHNVFGGVGAIRVVSDVAEPVLSLVEGLVGFDAVLVNIPIEGGAIAETDSKASGVSRS